MSVLFEVCFAIGLVGVCMLLARLMAPPTGRKLEDYLPEARRNARGLRKRDDCK